MRSWIALSLMVAAAWLAAPRTIACAGERAPMLAHMVFFELKENTDESTKKLVEGCNKYLSKHDGAVFFAVGTLAQDLQRDVNDRGFHVALHVVFKSREAHDRYQTSERHASFIEECKDLWKAVRVFDSYVAAPEKQPGEKKDKQLREKKDRPLREKVGKAKRKGDGERADADPARRIPLPDPATGFAGLVRGKVVERRGVELVLAVEEVPQAWEHSKAPDAKAMVGKQVVVGVWKEQGAEVKNIVRFLKQLQVGETVTLDVAHKGGETLAVLELTEEQRARVKAK